MSNPPKLFTCPRCKHRYLGHDPLPDCPSCGYDYPRSSNFRWDIVVYLLMILSLMSFFLVASFYHGNLDGSPATPQGSVESDTEKLPGSGSRPFQSPYHEPGRK